ncbi:MAG TPA: peptide chain release factor 2 [Patescibacteria group bacterium]|nr:peptide chain release factor 2 [Patescibacteria group bacterium]
MITIKEKVDELVASFENIRKNYNLAKQEEDLHILEGKSTDPEFWNNQESARKVMQELSDLNDEIQRFKEIESNITLLSDLAKQNSLSDDMEKSVSDTKRMLDKLKVELLLSEPFDKRSAIISIHAGQGGTEAMDWASMLYRMYLRFCEIRKWNTIVLSVSEGEEAGLKSVSVKIEGKYAYGYLKNEAGTHRLVRQSPFNADNLRQTSFALVEVLPELEETDLPDIQIKEEDLDWQFYRASTQGGQNVQKVSTAVRLKHIPSGIVVTSQTERFQEQNRKFALEHLRALLWIRKQEEEKNQVEKLKGEYRPASWGNQIRSYVLHPYKMVKDLRTNVETSDPDKVLDGEIDKFIEAELGL